MGNSYWLSSKFGTVWPLCAAASWLVTKQCLIMIIWFYQLGWQCELATKRDSKADVLSVSSSSERIYSLRRRTNVRNVSFRISLRWPIHIVNPVDKTKLSCNTPTDAAPQFFKKLTPLRCPKGESLEVQVATAANHTREKGPDEGVIPDTRPQWFRSLSH